MNALERLAQSLSETITTYLQPIADFLGYYVWSWGPFEVPFLVIVLLATGLYITTRLALIQVRGFKHAIDITRGKYDRPEDEGDLKHFQALTTALSATVGIGNIAGVAIAIRLGGPGALFWMWLVAFFGMALKFAECTLAVKYRKVHEDGSVSGGPMYYIEKGLGSAWKPMALFFALCCIVSSLGAGNMNQSNTMANQVQQSMGIEPVWTALVFAVLVATVILGGIKRIGKVTSILAPAMALMYVLGALVILLINVKEIPAGLALIVSQAFAPEPLVGGGTASFMVTLMWGVRRGLFSNEAGQGSAPIAHAAAKTDEPVREGLVASLEPFIDTLVICTMTGLVIVLSGAYKDKVEQPLNLGEVETVLVAGASDDRLLALRDARAATEGTEVQVVDGQLRGATLFYHHSTVEEALLTLRDQPWTGTLSVDPDGGTSVVGSDSPSLSGRALLHGAPLTSHGFVKGIGDSGEWIVTLAVVLFAVSTAISWSYYGDRATEYVFGEKAIHVYRLLFVGFFFLGAILPLQAVWDFGDVALGLMSFPNLIALLLLSGGLAKMTKDYFAKDHKPYK